MPTVKYNNTHTVKRIRNQKHRQLEGINQGRLSIASWRQYLLTAQQNEIAPTERLAWMINFRDWIAVVMQQSQSVDDAQIDCLLQMNQIAYQLCDWPMILEIFTLLERVDYLSLVMHSSEQNMLNTLHCAVAYWQLGLLSQASQLISKRLSLFSSDSPLHHFYHQLEQDRLNQSFVCKSKDDPDLFLIPLEEQHLSSFSWIYDEETIGFLCNLPEFSDDQQWFAWLHAEQNSLNKQVCAVNHREWGFIGVVSIEVIDGVGYCYYWLGQDFQGFGFGTKALACLLQMAQLNMGMQSCYAKVYQTNLSSQRILKKLNFVAVPFKIEAPNADQMYFYWGEAKADHLWWQELVDLAAIADIDSHIAPIE